MGGKDLFLFMFLVPVSLIGAWSSGMSADGKPRRILLDTDMGTDDFFALLYLLKQNRSHFDLKAVTINANAWTDAGHAVNHVYDILYMMNRDDIPVGVGGDGGILDDGTILADVGGYHPLIEQGMSTASYCRYRQAIPIGSGGRLDIDSNYGFRRSFLPQGRRRYVPLKQPTAQRVLADTISAGPTTLFVIGSHTNIALLLMTHPHLKTNIEHIFIMGGGVRSSNPTGCCPANGSSSCKPRQCGNHGNLFTAYTSNPYAEFNIFGDPFAAYQVFHSGIPVTLVPLDATNTIPINKNFFDEFERRQGTFEAQYCFKSLKMTRDTWFDNQFYTSYFMWDSFASGVAVSIMRNGDDYYGENEFAEMEFINMTVVTSNEPYGVRDGSNPFFDGRSVPKFNLQKRGVHSGHVQTGVDDPFCLPKDGGKGRCEDGYTKEVTGPESVRVLVAERAKPNQDVRSPLNRQFFKSFLDVLNFNHHSGRFNWTTQFPYYRETLYEPNFAGRTRGRPVVFDMDMSAGDFLALFYLLKAPHEMIDLKGILVNGNGWANAATIDIIYDVLHMMGRDDIPVGLGNVTALGTSILGCKFVQAIPHGSGGFIDSDTLFGLARDLPRSPRRYTAENSVKFGAPRDTDRPWLRQPLALEVWQSISEALSPRNKISVLTNGPLTNLASIIAWDRNAAKHIQHVYIVGGQVSSGVKNKTGNVFTVPTNKFAEFNMFLDPSAAKQVFRSNLSITLLPLSTQRKVSSFKRILETLKPAQGTPESNFVRRLLSLLHKLRQDESKLYHHVDMFLGELLGAVFLVDHSKLNPVIETKPITVLTGSMSEDGQIRVDERHGKPVDIVDDLDSEAYYNVFASLLGDKKQSAVVGSYEEQKKLWSAPPK
ncbi:nucleoside hydrolase 3-like isoform X3 [Curcuma longa]|uniref:nucleoside hydrolase 3-like isoform X3 n=1 Tax=Curcuma longa TaxID=136217 RepID=UPI003D9E2EE9